VTVAPRATTSLHARAYGGATAGPGARPRLGRSGRARYLAELGCTAQSRWRGEAAQALKEHASPQAQRWGGRTAPGVEALFSAHFGALGQKAGTLSDLSTGGLGADGRPGSRVVRIGSKYCVRLIAPPVGGVLLGLQGYALARVASSKRCCQKVCQASYCARLGSNLLW
jgi:hypothetical protein